MCRRSWISNNCNINQATLTVPGISMCAASVTRSDTLDKPGAVSVALNSYSHMCKKTDSTLFLLVLCERYVKLYKKIVQGEIAEYVRDRSEQKSIPDHFLV